MPHVTVEYTDNIAAEADVDTLLLKLNRSMAERPAMFPVGGIRSRAIRLEHYCVADGLPDGAFVHVIAKIAPGRPEDALKDAFDALFEVVKAHFAALYELRPLALSLEVHEFPRPTYKHNNIHSLYKRP